jgi:transposase
VPGNLRPLTAAEKKAIERLAGTDDAPARLVERARIIICCYQGDDPARIAARLQIDRRTVRLWRRRFQEHGLAGLEDRSRSGRPARYTPKQVTVVIATARADPRMLGLPFPRWTLDRLQAYLNEQHGIPIRRSRINEILLAVGLRIQTARGARHTAAYPHA